MKLLELASELGLELKRTSSNKGGEYHSACPACGEGKDRFVIWPQLNRYWCRRCKVSGDGIQFCRDFMKMTFQAACERLNDSLYLRCSREYHRPKREEFVIAAEPPKTWQDKALVFVEWSQKQLKRSTSCMEALYLRGLNESTINKFRLGCSINFSTPAQKDFYRDREDWGLPSELNVDGKSKKLWLPTGLVIPTMSNSGNVIKLKVRRHHWHTEDHLPKYVEISGSMRCPSIYGDIKHTVVVIVESEFDAIIIQQNIEDICSCVALGGVTKKPDFQCDQLLKNAKLILWCLDNDEAGKNAALWWRKSYSHLKFWPAPVGKSPGDAYKDHGINLRDWILKGIEVYSNGEISYQNSRKEVVNCG